MFSLGTGLCKLEIKPHVLHTFIKVIQYRLTVSAGLRMHVNNQEFPLNVL